MSIAERMLIALSRPPGSADYAEESGIRGPDGALSLFHDVFPDFETMVAGKRVVDFGCGTGLQCIALAEKFGCTVVGVDSNPKILDLARRHAAERQVSPDVLTFRESISPDMDGAFDVVISRNSFEHFPDPVGVLEIMLRLTNDSGKVLVTFGPPWFAPYGSHMHFFCKVPWLNLLFSEKTVMKVRARYRTDGAERYEDVESGLNRMSIARFESIMMALGLNMHYRRYDCIKGLDWLSSIPLARELFVNRISVVLQREHQTKPARSGPRPSSPQNEERDIPQ